MHTRHIELIECYFRNIPPIDLPNVKPTPKNPSTDDTINPVLFGYMTINRDTIEPYAAASATPSISLEMLNSIKAFISFCQQ